MIDDFLDRSFYGNTVLDYLIFAGAVLVGFAAITILRRVFVPRLGRWAKGSRTTLDDILVRILERAVVPLLYYGVFYASIRSLTLHPIIARGVDVAGALLMTFIGVWALSSALVYLIRTRWTRRADPRAAENATRAIIPAVHVIVWSLGALYLLENLGFKISAVVTGLGIGGIAVALAAQAVLGDLFAYFAILFDKPFEVGDFIIVDDYMGSVEHIGVKTTRLRSLNGEQLVFANTDLTKSRLHNYRRMATRRIEFFLHLRLDTPLRLAEQVPEAVAGIIKATEGVLLDRVHLASFDNASLNYDVVYIVQDSDYGHYMNIQQSINFRMMQEFERLGVQFAYPTQTLFVQDRNGRPSGTPSGQTKGAHGS
jgi:small-conductance mechanosensitive channel